jgi:Ras-related protein Rab-2A
MANNYNYLFKYIIIGDPSVGKSNILMKFAHNKFTDEYQATIGVEFGAKNIAFSGQIYRIQIWDTAGQENFRSITRAYYKNSVCALVVYDITSRESFEHVQNWIQDIKDQSPKTVLIVLVGNKVDLDENRVVSYDEGSEFAVKNGLIFEETSAKSGQGIEEVFQKSAKEIVKKMEENYYDLNSEICGIKKGSIRNKKNNNNNTSNNSNDKHENNKNNNIELKHVTDNGNNKGKKKCC